MRKYRLVQRILSSLSLCFFHIMIAVAAYDYCALEWGGKYAGYSLPPNIAFLYAIPFAAGMLVCAVLKWFLRKKR